MSFEIEIDFSAAAGRMAQEETEEFVGMIAGQLADHAQEMPFTEAVIVVQDGVTRALIEQIQNAELSSMIAGELLENLVPIMKDAAQLARDRVSGR